MSKVKCAIIGVNGYIGKHLSWYLANHYGIISEKYDVVNSDEPNYKKINISDSLSVNQINLDVDYIFLFAGLSGTFAGFDNYERYNSINEIGLMNLLDAIRKSPYRPKIIFPSSRLVYKGVDKPLKESDEKETKTIYAVNKLACEGLLHAYHVSFDIPYVIFRICVPYGNLLSTDYSYGTVGFFIKQAKAGKDITLYGDGSIKRTFTHMEDVCQQVIETSFSNKSNGETYNVGGETLSLKESAEIIARKFGVNVASIPWPDKDLRIESNHTYFDDSKIKSIVNLCSYKLLSDFSKDI